MTELARPSFGAPPSVAYHGSIARIETACTPHTKRRASNHRRGEENTHCCMATCGIARSIYQSLGRDSAARHELAIGEVLGPRFTTGPAAA